MARKVLMVYNLMAYPISALPLWKRILLRYCKTRVETKDGVSIHFKMLLGSMYLIKVVRPLQLGCKCEYHRGEFN